MLSKEQRDKIIELDNKGVSIAQIAREVKVSRQTVYKIIRENTEGKTKTGAGLSQSNALEIENDAEIIRLKKEIRMQELKNNLAKQKEEYGNLEDRKALWKKIETNWDELMYFYAEAYEAGDYKMDNCKHKNEEDYCLYWYWNEQIDSDMRYTVDNYSNKKWHKKADPIRCAFCHVFSKE